MTPFWAFIVGTLSIGTILAIVFGVFFMEGTEDAYRKGYEAGIKAMSEEQ